MPAARGATARTPRSPKGERASRAERSSAKRGGLLDLQSAAGNRSAGALIADLRKQFAPPDDGGGLRVLPPGGRAELAADRVAHGAGRRGARMAGLPRLSGGDMAGGVQLTSAFSKRITGRAGRGQALSGAVRRRLEPKLGLDLGRVRIHADREAGELTGALGAEAFAAGRDVFFSRGKFDPSTRSGEKRLMHELTHTVQQAGIERQAGRKRPKIGAGGALAVQCIISPGSFRRLTKDCPEVSAGETKRFNRVLTKLEAVWTAEQDAKEGRGASKRRSRLRALRDECQSFSDKNYHIRQTDYLTSRSHFVYELKHQARRELGEHVTSFYTSTLDGAEAQEKQAKTLLEMQDKDGVSLTATIWAHISHPDYSKFARARAKLVYANKKKLLGKESSKEIKEAAAKEVAKEKLGLKARSEEIQAYVNGLMESDCGHTWISFEQVDDSTHTAIDEKSFGFWPAEGGRPTDERRGEVRYPDETYKDKGGTRKKVYDINLDQYKAGVGEAFKWYLKPPTYMMVKRNCTTFARDIAVAAGIMMPTSFWLTPFYKDEVWNPNDLFDQMED